MVELEWHGGEPPQNLKVKQVYAVMFSSDGRIMLQIKIRNNKKMYSLSGGTPEPYDKTLIDTLKRELIEEVNTTIKDDIYLVGYQLVNENNGKPKYAQLRMAALIDKIGVKQPDPDTGETYDRVLVSPTNAIKLLDWGEIGKMIIEEACLIAQKKFGLNFSNTNEEYV